MSAEKDLQQMQEQFAAVQNRLTAQKIEEERWARQQKMGVFATPGREDHPTAAIVDEPKEIANLFDTIGREQLRPMLPMGTAPKRPNYYWVGNAPGALWADTPRWSDIPSPSSHMRWPVTLEWERYCVMPGCGYGRAFPDGTCYSHNGYEFNGERWVKPADGSYAPYKPSPFIRHDPWVWDNPVRWDDPPWKPKDEQPIVELSSKGITVTVPTKELRKFGALEQKLGRWRTMAPPRYAPSDTSSIIRKIKAGEYRRWWTS